MKLWSRITSKANYITFYYVLIIFASFVQMNGVVRADAGPIAKSSGGVADTGSTQRSSPGNSRQVDLPLDAGGQLQYSGTAIAGSRITIRIPGPLAAETTVRWVQVEGPTVALGDDTKPEIQFTIPPTAQKLGFEAVLKDSKGERTGRVTIPIRQAPSTNALAVHADAGDDQIGLVGHRMTLNGSRSSPRAEVRLRWFALGGPKVENGAQEESYYSFTPTVSGVYRFGLVAATIDADGEICIGDLDEVLVTVGEKPTVFGGSGAAGAGSGGLPVAAIDQILLGPSSISARETLDQVAGVFEAIATRTSLYTNFGELSSEMIRRLDAVIPADAQSRQFWSQNVFGPLSQYIVAEMLGSGLELRSPQGQQQALSSTQQDKLQKLFSLFAREIRSRTQVR
jgi:hypothetical protein